jgi:hypothetical protein
MKNNLQEDRDGCAIVLAYIVAAIITGGLVMLIIALTKIF